MPVALQIAKLDAGVAVLLTSDKRLIEFPSILLPPNLSCGSIVDIAVTRNAESEAAAARSFAALQDRILQSFGASEPSTPVLRCRNATQTSVVLEWDPIRLATSELLGLSLYRNGQKAGAIPRPLAMQSTKISGLAVDTEYAFHLVLRTTAGTYISEKVPVRTHKMTDLSGVTITMGIMPGGTRDALNKIVGRIGARIADEVRIDTTHFVTTEGRGVAWERAVEMNIPVVRPEWVDACEKSGRILGVTKFYLDAVRPVSMMGAPSGIGLGEAPSTKEVPERPRANRVESVREEKKEESIKEEKKEEEEEEEKGGEVEEDKVEEDKVDKEEKAAEEEENAEDKDENKDDKAEEEDKDEDTSKTETDSQAEAGEDQARKSLAGSEDSKEDKGRALTSPDGATFQDVAL